MFDSTELTSIGVSERGLDTGVVGSLRREVMGRFSVSLRGKVSF
jgi:hypothetical protein